MRRVLASTVCVLSAVSAHAIDVPDHGLDWVTVGDPGNPAFDGPWAFGGGYSFFRPVGNVDRVLRVTRTEVTVGQWFEFVEAFAPHFTGFAGQEFTSIWIVPTGIDGDGVPTFAMAQGAGRFPTTASLIYAATYCNWLHAGKSPEYEAIRDGAYDIATLELIGAGDPGYPDYRRRPGARYWITDLDEWTKAMYWDPDKGGPGVGGYWTYPHLSDAEPVPGVDTNAGRFWYDGPRPYDLFNVGSFPHAASPWGLLDGSGGENEWLDDEWDPWIPRRDFGLRRGTNAFVGYPHLDDPIGMVRVGYFAWTDRGFRLSSASPCVPDLEPEFGLLDLADVVAFVEAYVAGDPAADLAPPFGHVGEEDTVGFAEAFVVGCL